MKFLILISLILGCSYSYADNQQATLQTLENTLQNAKPTGAIESNNNSSIALKVTKTEKSRFMSDDLSARVCLAAAFMLQKDFYRKYGQYASNADQLDWGTENCLKDFDFSISAESKAFEIQVTNDKVSWKIDQEQKITKL